jgi:hypothetical protein
MPTASVTHQFGGDEGTRLAQAAATIPPYVLSERLAGRIGNYRATTCGPALRAEFDRFCSRLYWHIVDRDPIAAAEFRAGMDRRLRDAGEWEVAWTRE